MRITVHIKQNTINLAGLDPSSNSYKPPQPVEIAAKEKHLENVANIPDFEYWNFFDIAIYKRNVQYQLWYATKRTS